MKENSMKKFSTPKHTFWVGYYDNLGLLLFDSTIQTQLDNNYVLLFREKDRLFEYYNKHNIRDEISSPKSDQMATVAALLNYYRSSFYKNSDANHNYFNVYRVQANLKTHTKNLDKSILKSIDRKIVDPFHHISPSNKYFPIGQDTYAWGARDIDRNRLIFDRIQRGDMFLFFATGYTYDYAAFVTGKEISKEKSQSIWKSETYGPTIWSLIIYLQRPYKILIPYYEFNKTHGYEMHFSPKGIGRINNRAIRNIGQQYGSFNNWVSNYLVDESEISLELNNYFDDYIDRDEIAFDDYDSIEEEEKRQARLDVMVSSAQSDPDDVGETRPLPEDYLGEEELDELYPLSVEEWAKSEDDGWPYE